MRWRRSPPVRRLLRSANRGLELLERPLDARLEVTHDPLQGRQLVVVLLDENPPTPESRSGQTQTLPEVVVARESRSSASRGCYLTVGAAWGIACAMGRHLARSQRFQKIPLAHCVL